LSPPRGAPARPFSTDRLERIGSAVLRRMADHFRRLIGEVLPLFRDRLQAAGYPRRSADLYGVLFGAADVAMYDDTSTARLDRWLGSKFMDEIKQDIIQDHTPESRRCLDYMRSTAFDRRRPDSLAIGELIHTVYRTITAASGRGIVQGRLFDLAGNEVIPGDDDGVAASAQGKLLAIGLKVVERADGIGLIVANAHQGLAEVFAGTPWHTTSNAAGGGGWSHALRRAPGAHPVGPMRFRQGVLSRALFVPIGYVLPLDDQPADGAGEVPADQRPAAAPLH
jgi:hypothetical protein